MGKKLDFILAFLRWLIGAALLYGVSTESGFFTTLVLSLIFIQNEIRFIFVRLENR